MVIKGYRGFTQIIQNGEAPVYEGTKESLHRLRMQGRVNL